MDALSQVLLDQLYSRGEWPLTRAVLLSISGGRDSVALLHALLEAGIRPALFHCCYQLRGEDSLADARLVETLAAEHGLEAVVDYLPVDWAQNLKSKGENLQQAARRIRYRRLEELRTTRFENAVVVTAHHAEDQAETVLMALLKGRGLARLAGLIETADMWRPWLQVQSAQIQAYTERHGVTYREDQSNLSEAYDRNFVRHRLAPLMSQRFPGWVEALGREARDWARLEEGLRALESQESELGIIQVVDSPYGSFLYLQEELQKEAMHAVLVDRAWFSLGANRSQVEALRGAWDLLPGKKLACGQGTVYRCRKALCFFERLPHAWDSVPVLSSPAVRVKQELIRGWHRLEWDTEGSLPLDETLWTWRPVRAGDGGWAKRPNQTQPNLQGRRVESLSEALARLGIPQPLRLDWPVLCYRDVPVWSPWIVDQEFEGPLRITWTWTGPQGLISSHDPRPGNG